MCNAFQTPVLRRRLVRIWILKNKPYAKTHGFFWLCVVWAHGRRRRRVHRSEQLDSCIKNSTLHQHNPAFFLFHIIAILLPPKLSTTHADDYNSALGQCAVNFSSPAFARFSPLCSRSKDDTFVITQHKKLVPTKVRAQCNQERITSNAAQFFCRKRNCE